MRLARFLSLLPLVFGPAAVLLLGFPQATSGHGCLMSPPSWFDTHGLGTVQSLFDKLDTNHDGSLSEAEHRDGATIARLAHARDELTPRWGLCAHGHGLKTTLPDKLKGVHGLTSSPFWFSQGTRIPGVPTLKSEFYTYADELRLKNPWAAPGSAKLDGIGKSPCGWLRQEDGSSYALSGDARSLAPFPETETTVWAEGSVVEVKWAISANHGGGYAYRLCKKPADGNMMKLSETCFQQGHLDFVGNESWVEYRDGFRIPIHAKRTNEGTTPAGKTWTRNPIPGWKCKTGSPHSGGFAGIPGNPSDCKEFNFHPPEPSLAGYGYSANGEEASFNWALVDKVRIPPNLNGDYVLSWRWDSEQTSQVWAHCADVKIVDSVTTTTTTKPNKHVEFEWEAFPDSVCRLHENDQTTDGRGTIRHRGHLLDMFSLDACKFMCMSEIDCKGIEFHPDQRHCEVWTEDIRHVLKKPGSGYTCQILKTRPPTNPGGNGKGVDDDVDDGNSRVTTTTVAVPTGGGNSNTCSAAFGQCGGKSWNGPKCCQSGCRCRYEDEWYSQCEPPEGNHMCSGTLIFAEQIQESPLVEGVGGADSSNVVMAGVAMMFVTGALLAIKVGRLRQKPIQEEPDMEAVE